MTDREILQRAWHRSIFDGAECATLEEYAVRVADRLRIAYGDEVEPTVEGAVAGLRRRGMVK